MFPALGLRPVSPVGEGMLPEDCGHDDWNLLICRQIRKTTGTVGTQVVFSFSSFYSIRASSTFKLRISIDSPTGTLRGMSPN